MTCCFSGLVDEYRDLRSEKRDGMPFWSAERM